MTENPITPHPPVAGAPSPLAGLDQHDKLTLGGAAASAVLLLLGLLLPFVSISIGGFSGTVGAFEDVGGDGWFLGIPVGAYVLLGLIGVVAFAALIFTQRGSGPMEGRLYPLLEALSGAFAAGMAIMSFIHIDWKAKGDTGGDFLGALGIDVSVMPSIGFGVIFVGAAFAAIAGAFGFITHAKPKQ